MGLAQQILLLFSQISFLSIIMIMIIRMNAGTDWHPNLPLDQNMVTRGDLPRHVMESYEECRGPPRLFLLDKYIFSFS